MLLEVKGLSVVIEGRRRHPFAPRAKARILRDVSLHVAAGETLGLVGESGSGKTTLGRAILRRLPITTGRISFQGEDITHLEGEALRQRRRHMQMIFQDPYASLNPRRTVAEIIAEPLRAHGLGADRAAVAARVAELIALVGLPGDAATRHPHAFSGGQRQRVGIARALAMNPALVVADEPVSALDVSIRAQVINLMAETQARLGVAFLFIAHDLAVVRHISHRIAILYAGTIVESGPRDAVFRTPRHPYTRALIAAVPIPDPRAERARGPAAVPAGEAPSPSDETPGCRYASRCPLVMARCRTEAPPLRATAQNHSVACWAAD